MRKGLFDRHHHHCCGLLAVDSEPALEARIRADPSASVHTVGLVHAGSAINCSRVFGLSDGAGDAGAAATGSASVSFLDLRILFTIQA